MASWREEHGPAELRSVTISRLDMSHSACAFLNGASTPGAGLHVEMGSGARSRLFPRALDAIRGVGLRQLIVWGTH
jgi:hypothetical protein